MRNALYAPLRAVALALVLGAGTVLLAACGGAGDDAGPVTTRDAQEIVDQDREDDRMERERQRDERDAIALRVAAGECFSTTVGATADEWTAYLTTDRAAFALADYQEQVEWLDSLPVGCEQDDTNVLRTSREGEMRMVAALSETETD